MTFLRHDREATISTSAALPTTTTYSTSNFTLDNNSTALPRIKDSKHVLNKDFYPSTIRDKDATAFMRALANGQLSSIKDEKKYMSQKQLSSDQVSVLTYDAQSSPYDDDSWCSNAIFVRSFYPDLLASIRSSKKCVLIGNPGIGKSFFQYYYMARIFNPSLWGPLPPDYDGSCDAPKIIVRQEGANKMTVFDVENMVAELYRGIDITLVSCFDPKTTLYLMEPVRALEEPLACNLPTLATVSPNIRRYKEFCKNGAIMYYMPLFTLKELLSIGEYMVANDGRLSKNTELLAEFNQENIHKRYEEFGGIFRHVLPASLDYLDDVRLEKARAILAADASVLLNSSDIEPINVSHFLMSLDAERKGKRAFKFPYAGFVNSNIVELLRTKIADTSIAEKRACLLRNDETGAMADACPILYEEVVACLLTQSEGVYWNRRRIAFDVVTHKGEEQGLVAPENSWEKFNLKLHKLMQGKVPKYDEMDELVLYKSLNKNYGAVDMLYKDENGDIVGIQVTRQMDNVKKVKSSALREIIERQLEMPNDKKLQLVLVPHPKRATKAKISISGKKKQINTSITVPQQVAGEYWVWQAPVTYEYR